MGKTDGGGKLTGKLHALPGWEGDSPRENVENALSEGSSSASRASSEMPMTFFLTSKENFAGSRPDLSRRKALG